MAKGGAERMQAAVGSRRKLVEMIEWGEPHTKVFMSLDAASLNFGIAVETLEKLSEKDKGLGMYVKGKVLIVELLPGKREKRQAYLYLYGLVQQTLAGGAREIFDIPGARETLSREFPRLRETLEVIESGKSTFELRLLHIQLAAYYEALGGDTTNLPHWQNVLTSVGA